MGNRRISLELKECSLNLWDKGWELKDIADTLLVSQASLYRWRTIFEDHNSVTKAPCTPLGPATTRLTRAMLTASHRASILLRFHFRIFSQKRRTSANTDVRSDWSSI